MSGPTRYALHDGFVAPARAFPQLWRFAVGMVLAIAVYFLLIQLYFTAIASFNAALVGRVFDGATPGTVFLLMFSFAFMAAGAVVAARLMHRRGLQSLLGPIGLFWADFRSVCIALIVLFVVVLVLPPWDMGGDIVPNMAIGQWIILLVPGLLIVLLQVSAEEVMFRGYMQQQLAARFRSPLIWMVLPSAFFALGHYSPDSMGENAVIVTGWSLVFGMLMADLTARSGSLGPAIAVHFCNNVSAILFISAPDMMNGLALYVAPFSMTDTEALRAWMPAEFAMTLVMWLAARVAIRR